MTNSFKPRDKVRHGGAVWQVHSDHHLTGLTLIKGDGANKFWKYDVNPGECALYVPKSLSEMMAEVEAFERSKGWRPNDNQFGTSLALLHSEISEMLEAFREGDWGHIDEENGKPEGVASEAADVFIRLLSTWAQFLDPLGFDIEDSYELKMAYNRTRSHRHGGKAI